MTPVDVVANPLASVTINSDAVNAASLFTAIAAAALMLALAMFVMLFPVPSWSILLFVSVCVPDLVVISTPSMARTPAPVRAKVVSLASPTSILPVRTEPVVVIVLEPVSIVPNPDVIEPEFKAPVVTNEESPGYPVVLERTPEDGVPRAGVTSVGDVANTSAPLPVSLEITPAN